MFEPSRDQIRRFYCQAWRKHRAGEALEPLEKLVAEVILEHPEYQHLLEDPAAALDFEFTPERGQTNPFLHMGMHLALREHLASQRPAGIAEVYQALLARYQDPHAVEHHMMECLGAELWRAQREQRPANEQDYLECLRRLLPAR